MTEYWKLQLLSSLTETSEEEAKLCGRVLGLKDEDFKQCQITTTVDIEKRLVDISLDITRAYYGDEKPASVLLAMSTQLPLLLQQDINDVAAKKEENVQLKHQILKEISSRLELLTSALDSTHKLATLQLTTEATKNATFAEYFATMFDAIYMKLKSLYLQTILEIYDDPRRLVQIRKTLLTERQGLQGKISEARTLLAEYQSAGMEFNSLVVAYTSILRSIEDIERDLTLLK